MDFQGILDILLKYWPMFLRGAGVTLLISIVGTILGTCIGLLVGIIRTIPAPEKKFKKAIATYKQEDKTVNRSGSTGDPDTGINR